LHCPEVRSFKGGPQGRFFVRFYGFDWRFDGGGISMKA
jgi:hypothetical protein